MVERQSAPSRKWRTEVTPFARAPNIMLLWEMDLSPGMVISPFRGEDDLICLINNLPYIIFGYQERS